MSIINRIQKELKSFPQLKPVIFYDYPYKGDRHEAILLAADTLPKEVDTLVSRHSFISLPLATGEGAVFVLPHP